jgi:hypothetical protein
LTAVADGDEFACLPDPWVASHGERRLPALMISKARPLAGRRTRVGSSLAHSDAVWTLRILSYERSARHSSSSIQELAFQVIRCVLDRLKVSEPVAPVHGSFCASGQRGES